MTYILNMAQTCFVYVTVYLREVFIFSDTYTKGCRIPTEVKKEFLTHLGILLCGTQE